MALVEHHISSSIEVPALSLEPRKGYYTGASSVGILGYPYNDSNANTIGGNYIGSFSVNVPSYTISTVLELDLTKFAGDDDHTDITNFGNLFQDITIYMRASIQTTAFKSYTSSAWIIKGGIFYRLVSNTIWTDSHWFNKVVTYYQTNPPSSSSPLALVNTSYNPIPSGGGQGAFQTFGLKFGVSGNKFQVTYQSITAHNCRGFYILG